MVICKESVTQMLIKLTCKQDPFLIITFLPIHVLLNNETRHFGGPKL